MLLSLADVQSCASSHKVCSADSARGEMDGVHEIVDSAEFVPLHPPVIIPRTWREAVKDSLIGD